MLNQFLKMFIFFHLLLCGEYLIGKENTLIFVTPILENKTSLLKENLSSKTQEALFNQIRISKYKRWIQTIEDRDFLIHQIEGKNLSQSLKSLKDEIQIGNTAALALQTLYVESLGLDITTKDWIPGLVKLTDFMDMQIENLNEEPSKEYCFVYPVLPSKKALLLDLYETNFKDNLTSIQNIYKYRGIDKTQLWLQESDAGIYVVVYQDILGPVETARNKYLSSKEDYLSKYIADKYSEITGLSYEKLLPTLESLDDSEILH